MAAGRRDPDNSLSPTRLADGGNGRTHFRSFPVKHVALTAEGPRAMSNATSSRRVTSIVESSRSSWSRTRPLKLSSSRRIAVDAELHRLSLGDALVGSIKHRPVDHGGSRKGTVACAKKGRNQSGINKPVAVRGMSVCPSCVLSTFATPISMRISRIPTSVSQTLSDRNWPRRGGNTLRQGVSFSLESTDKGKNPHQLLPQLNLVRPTCRLAGAAQEIRR